MRIHKNIFMVLAIENIPLQMSVNSTNSQSCTCAPIFFFHNFLVFVSIVNNIYIYIYIKSFNPWPNTNKWVLKACLVFFSQSLSIISSDLSSKAIFNFYWTKTLTTWYCHMQGCAANPPTRKNRPDLTQHVGLGRFLGLGGLGWVTNFFFDSRSGLVWVINFKPAKPDPTRQVG